ncbi:hypothetical protein [Chondromyces crocatus]|uniref:Lipoprotein n=1 Tax=Chondromyces crocatus TaxID=52 RepID=A0A0K1ESI2_CHOCO|nr:hypothetical protein [Chondromyces crocatus]AKT43597.1 uncharacterized protein CMC5_078320 [Chondromyces crocatus]
MRMLRSVLAVATLAVAGGLAVGCALGSPEEDAGDEPIFGEVHQDPGLRLERTPEKVSGAIVDEGVDIRFSSVEHEDGALEVRVELNGMVLSARYDESGTVLDGVNAGDGSPTAFSEVDRAAVRRLLAALEAEFFPSIEHVTTKEEYDAARRLTAAEERLFRAVDVQWSQWPTAMPLRREILGEAARAWTSWRRYAATNTTVTGCHDCNKCSFSGDCCDTGKKLGENFSGANYGNCGTSSNGSQFTKDCTNHDQCVRTSKHGGHAMASPYCNDQFAACVDDEAKAPSCKYDWRGTSRKGNCPASYKGDGACDCFCQFQDTDC